MKKLLIAAMAALTLATTMTSCGDLWNPFDDQPLIEELPLTFEVKRTYVGKYESDLDALLVRLGCVRQDSPVHFNEGWNAVYLVQQDMSHLSYYVYDDGTDRYLVILNSTNKSGKTFQVICEKDYDSQLAAGLDLLDREIEYMDGKTLLAYDAKMITVGGQVISSFDSKADFVSQVKEGAESLPMWGISCNYTKFEGTMVYYSQVNYGSSYLNSLCLGNDDADVNLSSFTNSLGNMFAKPRAAADGRRVEVVLAADNNGNMSN